MRSVLDVVNRRAVANCFLSPALTNIPDAESEVYERGANDRDVVVCLRTTGKLIGDLFAEPENDTISVFSVGWSFNSGFGGQDYAHEATTALFTYLFTKQTARRLYA